MLPAVAKMLFRLPDAADVIDNPDPDELKQLAARMRNARWTRYESLNVQTDVVSRSKKSTYIVTDEPDGQNQAITREEGERWAERQDAYIADQEMVVIDGYIGNDPDFRTPARLYIEAANANIAGMQQQLYFSPAEEIELEPELTVIYTPNLKAEGYPDDRLIAVDLDQGVTRVFNSDFFAWMPNGRVYATENGCFAKTFGLNPEDEPTIYGAVTQPRSYLENVSQHGDEVDFYDTNYTSNGRATFPFDVIEAASADEIEEAHFLLILNKNENIVPAVAKLEGPQAAAFFMLGETTGTSAGGADEAGKFLRVPGTNPFFPMPHDLQGNRFLELLEEHPLEVYVLNTGSVGGKVGAEGAKKVRIPHSSAIVKGIAEGTIEWERDPDFGYLVASSVPGIDAEDLDVLQPKRLYEAQGRVDEYASLVERFKAERTEFLRDFPSLSDEIVAAVG